MEGAAVVELAERGVLSVSGPDRQKFLHRILSNEVLALAPGEGRPAALLTVKGHLVALLRVLATKDAVLLEMNVDRLKPAEDLLTHYKVAAPVRFAVKPSAVLAVLGPEARAVLARAGCEVPELAAEGHVAGRIADTDVIVARAGDMPAGGCVVHASPDAAAAIRAALESAGAVPIGRDALDILRVEEGHPWFGPDVTEENLLHETGLVQECHSATKGCYVGQEVVARLEARGGNVNKRMRGLRLQAPAAAGALVSADGKEAGHVTTAVVSPRLGPIALAYVRRGHSEPGTAVEVGGAPAIVVSLPFEAAP